MVSWHLNLLLCLINLEKDGSVVVHRLRAGGWLLWQAWRGRLHVTTGPLALATFEAIASNIPSLSFFLAGQVLFRLQQFRARLESIVSRTSLP